MRWLLTDELGRHCAGVIPVSPITCPDCSDSGEPVSCRSCCASHASAAARFSLLWLASYQRISASCCRSDSGLARTNAPPGSERTLFRALD